MREVDPATIRILHFVYTLEGGGAEHQLRHFVNNSHPKPIQNAICCFDETGMNKIQAGNKIYVINRNHKYDLCFWEIKEVLRDWGPDIIHIWLPNILQYGLPAPRLLGKVKIIASYRGNYRLASLRQFFQIPFFLLSDSIVSNVPLACLNPPYKQLFKLKKGRFIPNGFPIQNLSEEEYPSQVGMNDKEEFTLLFAGRLNPVKNIPILFHALNILLSRGVQCNLVIAGNGILHDQLIKLSHEMNLNDRVTFSGYQDDLAHLMKRSDLLVLPSFREGMSNSLFEAMALGLPVAASDIPVHRFWLEHGKDGILFDPHNPADLADKIEILMEKPDHEVNRIIDNARNLVNELSITHMVDNYEQFYRELIENENIC